VPGFREARAALGKKPPRVVVFPPTIFADTWAAKPTDDVAIGLRIPSDYDVSCARANAAQRVADLHAEGDDRSVWIDAMNDAVFREVCALAMTDPNNVAERYFPLQDDDVYRRLSSEGVKRVFDEVERLAIETSPVHVEATDDEVSLLAELLITPEAIDVLPTFKAKRARRLLKFLLDELVATEVV